MHADPIGILVCPNSISEELLFQAAAKIDCLAIVIYNRVFNDGRFFVCRYDPLRVCPHCLRAEPMRGIRRCIRHEGHSSHVSMVLSEYLTIEKGVRLDIDHNNGDLIIRSSHSMHDLFELADPRTTVDGLADRILNILEGYDSNFGPYAIDS